jgi:hemolysin III
VSEQLKPTWRGWIHVVGVGLLLVATTPLLCHARSVAAAGWCVAFVVGVGAMMGVSALYHRITWAPEIRRRWKRADHATIFAAIAGSYISLGGLTLHGTARWVLLIVVGGGSAAGVAIRELALDAPKWVNVIPYIAVGWAAVFFLPQIARGGGDLVISLVIAGGVAYTLGALCYAAKRPVISVKHFGYHELFHLGTVIGAGCHYGALWAALGR